MPKPDSLPLELEDLIVRMTAKDPAQRVQSFDAVLRELSRTDLNGSPRMRILRRLRMAKFTLPLVAAAALAGIAFAVFHRPQPGPPPQTASTSVSPKKEVQPQPASPTPANVDHPGATARDPEPASPSPAANSKPKPTNETRTATAVPERPSPSSVREKTPNPQPQSTAIPQPVSQTPLTVEPPPRTKLAAGADVPPVTAPNFPQTAPPQGNAAEPQIAKNAPTGSSPSSAAIPTRKPDSPPDYASARREILGLLQRYSNAYRTKDFSAVAEIRKDLTDAQRKALRNAFSQPGSLTLQLDPQSGPDFGVVPDGQSPEKATVQCRRVVTFTAPSLRRPAVTEDVVTFHLARVNGEWKIVAGS